jgi:hypothetical protein
LKTRFVSKFFFLTLLLALILSAAGISPARAAANSVPPPAMHVWTFNTDASDSVGAATATLFNGAAVSGCRLRLDGVDDYASLPSGITSGLTNASFEAWVTWNNDVDWPRVFDFGTGTTSYMFLTARNDTDHKPGFAITTGSGAGEQVVTSTDALSTGTQVHILVTLDDATDTARLYIDGTLVGTNTGVTLTPASLGTTTLNYLGKSQYGQNPYFSGAINEFRIYDRALSLPEIETSYASGPSLANCTPSVTTNAATGVTFAEATLNGTVNPFGTGMLTVSFEYGQDTNYGSTLPAVPASVAGFEDTSVSVSLSGLQTDTTYHFRANVVGGAGTFYGNDQIFITSHTAGVRFAKPSATGTGSCSSWANACLLQTALTNAVSGDEIWVAAGMYKPTGGTDRAATFQLRNDVAVYGGFAGTEAARDERNPATNVTTLSGEIGGGSIGDNSYHVVTGAAGATLDGFTVTAGYADNYSPSGNGGRGGAIFNNSGTLTVSNLIISNNKGVLGPGIYNSGTLVVSNSTFSGNISESGHGGGIYNQGTLTVISSTFTGNWGYFGGGIMNNSPAPGTCASASAATIVNSTFSGNSAGSGGSGIYNNYGVITLLFNTITANSSGGVFSRNDDGTCTKVGSNIIVNNTGYDVRSGYTTQRFYSLDHNLIGVAGMNVDFNLEFNQPNDQVDVTDPKLGAFGNYGGSTQTIPLLPGSPAIDTGNDGVCPEFDQRGSTRAGSGAHCDIGAFESQGFSLAITGGNNQSVLPNAAFPIPLTVSVTANDPVEPVNGGQVTFVPPSSGASVVITGSPALIADGAASITATANDTTGAYSVTASASGAASVNFSLANTATPVITWANPANIVYGTPLSDTQLNATANTPGVFTYTPASGAVLTVGVHTLHVDFVPTDTVNYTNTSKDVSITVTQATPVITWAAPATIVYGTALGATQLNAAADVPGAFTYTPASGTVLAVGMHTLHVDFVPTDTVNYSNASKDVSITVTQAAPVITWANPADIVYGTILGGTQLNATTNVPGAFTYTPAAGTVLTVGTHSLHVDFAPTDTVNYANASKNVSITVTQATPVITWADPANVSYGTPLSSTQLNATANTPGTFTYTPAAGAYLAVGSHTLHVDFVPADTVNYANASKDVSLTVLDHVLFADVPDGYWARPFIERLYLNQVTGGCGSSPLTYCPAKNVTRAQMAVFVLRAAHGATFAPPAATGTVFTDVPADSFAAAWIEQLVAEGITGGCGGNNFCPNAPITRAQMAVFLVKAMYGAAYTPPDAVGGIFADVPADGFAAAFIEQLVADGITGGCGGGEYCPNAYVTRAEMAVFLVAAFALP